MSVNKIIAFDGLRILAAFAVVVLHTVAPLFMDSYPSSDWNVANVYESLVHWSVPVFFMISGALFLNKGKELNFGRLYKKNIFRIFLIYLFWSIVYTLPLLNDGLSLSYILFRILNGPFHFWFLKILIGLYIAVPLFRTITSNRKTEEYFLLFAMLMGIILPSVLSVLELFDTRLMVALRDFCKGFDMTFVSTYSFYFVLGHYLLEYPISATKKRALYIIGIVSPILLFGANYYGSSLLGNPYQEFLSNSFVCTMFLAITIYLFFVNCNFGATRAEKVLAEISKCTFGVYIIHVLVMNLLWKLDITPSTCSPFWFVPLYALIVFVISLFITFVLQRIPFVNRWLV
jgi:surface polysaccharide O-acyltransferase-like enzyme